jgi:hypothetical protein
MELLVKPEVLTSYMSVQYDACALHAGQQGLKTHTQNSEGIETTRCEKVCRFLPQHVSGTKMPIIRSKINK